MYFLKTLQVCAPYVMGVCCIVFDIDGMLFELCMNFLNIGFLFPIFYVFFAFDAITNIIQNWCTFFFLGGGGC